MRYVMRDMNTTDREFYRRLDSEGRICTTRCRECGELSFPPRRRCPRCGGDGIIWEALSGRGELYAFTQQERALRFAAPAVIGLAKLEEGVTVFGVVLAPYEQLQIGQAVEATVVRDDAGPPVIGFKPIANQPDS